MEEKKSIKISLKTYLITMFLMLLIIGILLGYILQTGERINKEITEKNNNEIVVENAAVNEKIESDEAENVIENNELKDEETDVIEESKDEKVFSEDEIKDVLESYLNIFHGYGAQEQLLNSLDLMTNGEAQKYIADDDNYKTTDIPFEEFEKKIKQYTTLDNFEKLNKNGKFVNPHFKNVNGFVAYFDGGWTGIEYVVNDVTIKGDYSDTRYVANYYTIEGEATGNEITLEFDIENNGGNCIISNCYFE